MHLRFVRYPGQRKSGSPAKRLLDGASTVARLSWQRPVVPWMMLQELAHLVDEEALSLP
jgi:hypothetical protein